MPVGDKDSAFYESPEYLAAENLRALPRMLLGGSYGSATDAIRAESERWIPPYSDAEKKARAGGGQSDYDKRVQGAVVEPYYEDAVKNVMAAILAEPLVLEDDVPLEIRGTRRTKAKTDDANTGDDIEGWAENIDLRGNNIDVFLRPLVMDLAGEGGMSCILVDHSPVPAGASAADVQRLGLRPYWRHYRATDVLLPVEAEYPGGRECIRRIRLRDGLDQEGRETVRIIEAARYNEREGRREGFVTWRTVAKVVDETSKTETEVETGSGTMEPHQEIPLAVGYFNYRGFFRARPCQLALAHLNLKHTRQDCEIADDLSVSSGAQWVMRGAKTPEEKAQRAIGKRVTVSFADADGDAHWEERSGSAATVFMSYQQRQEDKMRAMARLPMVQRTGNITATSDAINTARTQTEVEADSGVVKDMVERALTFTDVYVKRSAAEPKGGSVTLKLPPILRQRDPDGIRLLLESYREIGLPTADTILAQMIAQDFLPDDVNVAAEVASARDREAKTRLAMEAARTALAAQNVAPGAGSMPAGTMPQPMKPNGAKAEAS